MAASRYRRLAQVALGSSFGQSPSDDLGLANRRDWTPRRLSPCLSPWFSALQGRVNGIRLWRIRWLMPHSAPPPGLSPAVRRCCAACSGRRVQSRVLVFKDGHPNLVRLPSPVPNRLADGEPTVSPRRARFGGGSVAETAELRTSDAPSRPSAGPSARCRRQLV